MLFFYCKKSFLFFNLCSFLLLFLTNYPLGSHLVSDLDLILAFYCFVYISVIMSPSYIWHLSNFVLAICNVNNVITNVINIQNQK